MEVVYIGLQLIISFCDKLDVAFRVYLAHTELSSQHRNAAKTIPDAKVATKEVGGLLYHIHK